MKTFIHYDYVPYKVLAKRLDRIRDKIVVEHNTNIRKFPLSKFIRGEYSKKIYTSISVFGDEYLCINLHDKKTYSIVCRILLSFKEPIKNFNLPAIITYNETNKYTYGDKPDSCRDGH